jgi:hypothetical protein
MRGGNTNIAVLYSFDVQLTLTSFPEKCCASLDIGVLIFWPLVPSVFRHQTTRRNNAKSRDRMFVIYTLMILETPINFV